MNCFVETFYWVYIYGLIYIIIHLLYMYVQTIYWQDFTLDFLEIRWTFGRAWDWANFRESHEKFVRFGNSDINWQDKKVQTFWVVNEKSIDSLWDSESPTLLTQSNTETHSVCKIEVSIEMSTLFTHLLFLIFIFIFEVSWKSQGIATFIVYLYVKV